MDIQEQRPPRTEPAINLKIHCDALRLRGTQGLAVAPAARQGPSPREASAWMGAHTGNRTLMDIARERARQYLRVLPTRDRIMLVRADALATPATRRGADRNVPRQ